MAHDPPNRRPRRATATTPPATPKGRNDRHDPQEEGAPSDRPTVNPPFDIEAFAKQSAVGSPAPPNWSSASRLYPSAPPPARPPPPDLRPEPTRPEQITQTNEVELERARLSSVKGTESPRFHTPSALSFANLRAPSVPQMPAVRPPTPASVAAVVAGANAALGAGGPEITERTIDDPIAEMRERLSLGDYTGALEMAELLLAEDPSDAEAAECADSCRGVLEGMYAARLGPLDKVPVIVVQRAQLRWLSIDHRAGFILSLVDGSSTLEMILDVCGMPRLDAMKILQELLQKKVLSLR
jgi:hypothetical protein